MLSSKRSNDSDDTISKKIKSKPITLYYYACTCAFSIEDRSCLESLSNDIFYEIFEYFDGCDLIQAFSQLNRRLENLIQYSSLPLTIQFTSQSESKLEENCRNVIIPYKHRIRSLHLSGYDIAEKFFRTCTINDSFTRLESTILSEISRENTISALFYLKSLPKLSSLTIELEDDYYPDGSIIVEFIFQLPTLKYLSITTNPWEFDIDIPRTINSKPSPIERMILNVYFRVSELITIVQHTPKLKYLSCIRIDDSVDINLNDQSPLLTQLTHLSIKNFQADFTEFEYLIKRISSQLQILYLKASNFRSFLSENRWRQLINKHMPVLREFHFGRPEEIDDEGHDYDYFEPDIEVLKAFTSSFWTDRNWYVQLTDTNEQYEFSIHSADPEKSNIQLKISEYDANSWYNGYLEKAKPIYEAIEFTHLSIDCTDLPPNLMIQILRLLPKLTSLEVISLPLFYSYDLCSSFVGSELEMLSFILINSKITRVTARQTTSIEFILELCPRIQYLEIEYTRDLDLEKIIGSIAVNNRTHSCYLNCICLMNPTMNDVIIQDLQRCINFERLSDLNNEGFNNYIIREKDRKIFLTWELH